MHWQDTIVDWSMEKALKAYDSMFREVLYRFEDGNPMRFITASQFKRIEDQMYDARSAEAWNNTRKEFRNLLVTLLNNIFDSLSNPAGIEDSYVDRWLLMNGFGDGTIQEERSLVEEVKLSIDDLFMSNGNFDPLKMKKYIAQRTQGEQE